MDKFIDHSLQMVDYTTIYLTTSIGFGIATYTRDDDS